MNIRAHVRDEEHVQKAVEDRHVQSNQEDDEFLEEELKWPKDEFGELLGEGSSVQLLLGDIGIVTCLFPESSGSLEKDSWCVCLWDSKDHENVDKPCDDKLDPV